LCAVAPTGRLSGKLRRAEQLARRKEIYEALYPEATEKERERLGGKLRHNPAMRAVRTAECFAKDTATKTGVSPCTIRRGVQIATRISKDIQRLRGMANLKQFALGAGTVPRPQRVPTFTSFGYTA